MKPEQLEIARLKREVTKLKAERDILKKAAAYFAEEDVPPIPALVGLWHIATICCIAPAMTLLEQQRTKGSPGAE